MTREECEALATKIVDEILDPDYDDIGNVTHGNYTTGTFVRRLRSEWIMRVTRILTANR